MKNTKEKPRFDINAAMVAAGERYRLAYLVTATTVKAPLAEKKVVETSVK